MMLTPRHFEALETLAGMRPKAGLARAARMSDLDAYARLLKGEVFDFEERDNGRVLQIRLSGEIVMQVCSHTMMSLATGPTTWTFPRPFRDTKTVVLLSGTDVDPTTPRVITRGSPTETEIQFSARENGVRVAARMDLFALGLGAKS